MNYKQAAKLVAAKLTKDQLIKLAELLDGDAGNDFCFHIQEETAKVAPHLYADTNDKIKEEKA